MNLYSVSKRLKKRGNSLLSVAILNKDKLHVGPSNCWGTTLFFTGGQPVRKFVHSEFMQKWIENNTKKIPKRLLKEGDILSIYKGWFRKELIHTAVYVGEGLYFHQEGYQGPMKVEPLGSILETYWEYSKYRYTRKIG